MRIATPTRLCASPTAITTGEPSAVPSGNCTLITRTPGSESEGEASRKSEGHADQNRKRGRINIAVAGDEQRHHRSGGGRSRVAIRRAVGIQDTEDARPRATTGKVRRWWLRAESPPASWSTPARRLRRVQPLRIETVSLCAQSRWNIISASGVTFSHPLHTRNKHDSPKVRKFVQHVNPIAPR